MTEKLLDKGDQIFGLEQDQQAGVFITDGLLRVIYEMILNLAYSLFVASVTIAITYDTDFKQHALDFAREPQNKWYIVVLIILAVLVLALSKIYSSETEAKNPRIKKAINFFEDILRGIIFIISLLFLYGFVTEKSGQTFVLVSYIIYIISGVLFFAIGIIKWVYYYCGKGKNNYLPWSSKPTSIAHILNTSKNVQNIIQKIIKGDKDKPKEQI